MENDQKRRLVYFVETYLQQDGIFIVQLIGHNANRITVGELVNELFKRFEAKHTEAVDDKEN